MFQTTNQSCTENLISDFFELYNTTEHYHAVVERGTVRFTLLARPYVVSHGFQAPTTELETSLATWDILNKWRFPNGGSFSSRPF